jgi:hypothetical protein
VQTAIDNGLLNGKNQQYATRAIELAYEGLRHPDQLLEQRVHICSILLEVGKNESQPLLPVGANVNQPPLAARANVNQSPLAARANVNQSLLAARANQNQCLLACRAKVNQLLFTLGANVNHPVYSDSSENRAGSYKFRIDYKLLSKILVTSCVIGYSTLTKKTLHRIHWEFRQHGASESATRAFKKLYCTISLSYAVGCGHADCFEVLTEYCRRQNLLDTGLVLDMLKQIQHAHDTDDSPMIRWLLEYHLLNQFDVKLCSNENSAATNLFSEVFQEAQLFITFCHTVVPGLTATYKEEVCDLLLEGAPPGPEFVSLHNLFFQLAPAKKWDCLKYLLQERHFNYVDVNAKWSLLGKYSDNVFRTLMDTLEPEIIQELLVYDVTYKQWEVFATQRLSDDLELLKIILK